MRFDPELKRKPLSAQRAWQEKALARHLRYLVHHSPYYQNKLRGMVPNEGDSLSLDRLPEWPTTSKEDLGEQNASFFAAPPSSVREYTSTSGTLGTPVTMALTEKDLQRLGYNESQSFQMAGASADDIYQLMLTLDRQFMAGMAYYEGIRRLGGRLVRTGPGLPAMQWETIQRLGTTTLVTVPSFLLHLAEWIRSSGASPSSSRVIRALCIGESVRDESLQLNALGQRIQEIWPMELINTYASTEMQTAFTECPRHQGMHAQPDLILFEILDEQGNPLPPGEFGELTVTPLGIEGTPLFRYRTGDITAVFTEPCDCGLSSPRLSPLRGRKQQMIKYRGTTLYPPAIQNLLMKNPLVEDFLVEVFRSRWDTDELRIHLHSPREEDLLRKTLIPLFQAHWRVVPPLVFHDRDSLRALQQADSRRKPMRFRDCRRESPDQNG